MSGGVRYLVLVLASVCLTSILSNMATYNFTKICISNDTSAAHSQEYSKSQKSMLQSCVAVGALAASLPYTYLFARYPHRYVFLSAGVITTVATAVIPLANSFGFGYFLVARIFQGVAFSATFPLIGAITADWASLKEHGLFIGLLTGCTQLSNIFTMPVSGALCSSSWGWPAVYYVHASVAFVAFLVWAFFYRDHPEDHFCVRAEEAKKIGEGKDESHQKGDANVPYSTILKSATIWGVWIASFGDLISVQLVSMFNPQYLKDYLKYDVLNTGIMAALPVIAQFAAKMIGGVSSDAIRWLSETAKLRIYNTIALGASAVFFVGLAFVPPEKPVLGVVILVITESLIGFNTAGFNKCATLHSRQYAPFVMTQIMNIWAVTILVEPFFVNPILGDGDETGWRNVFLVHAAILLVCNFIFCIWADGRPAIWTQNGNTSDEFDNALEERIPCKAMED